MKKMFVLLCFVALAGFAMAQTYTSGSGIVGVDKLGAHQNGGRGCVGCHAPHSGARGNGGNAATGGGAVTDPNTGNYALWGEDLGPLYGITRGFGDDGSYAITLPSSSAGLNAEQEQVLTGVVMCLSCHDGNVAKGAMMANKSYEQANDLLPAGYGPQDIPTLLGDDGTGGGNYKNDHPIGPSATLGAVGLIDHSNPLRLVDRVVWATGACTSHGTTVDCIQPNPADSAYLAFINHYGSFNVTMTSTPYPAGARTTPVVMPNGSTDPAQAYVVCTTCHTPHSMYTFSGTAATVKGTYPTYFFLAAPYNPGSLTVSPTQASSATQFCRQCHFTGAGGANEGSGIMNVTTQF